MKSTSARLLVLMVLTVALSAIWMKSQVRAANSMDPCAIYPHQVALIAAATPTQKVVTGVAGKQIYICGMHEAQLGATPGLALWYGKNSNVGASPTACATGAPAAVSLGAWGSGTSSAQTNIGSGQYTIAGPVPSSAATPPFDLCAVTTTGSFINCTLEYVIR